MYGYTVVPEDRQTYLRKRLTEQISIVLLLCGGIICMQLKADNDTLCYCRDASLINKKITKRK